MSTQPRTPDRLEVRGDWQRLVHWTSGPIAGYWYPGPWCYVPRGAA